MILINPFTRQVLINANPRGDNQYINPDGPSQKPVRTAKHLVKRLTAGVLGPVSADRVAGFALPDDSLVGGLGKVHEELIREDPEKFGMDRGDMPKDPVAKAISKGAIRFRGVSIELDSNRHSPGKIGMMISSGKLPSTAEGHVYIDSADFNGAAHVDELLMAKSWRHLAYGKKRLR
jgi:hypothetical protein